MRRAGLVCLALAVWSGVLILFSTPAWAVPSYSRRYGVTCSACHTTWGALSGAGITFRLSGYRAMNGRDLEPTVKDVPLAGEEVTIPATLPFSIVTGVGVDYRHDHLKSGGTRTTANIPPSTGSTSGRTGFSLDLEDISIFLTTPIGKHLAIFSEFPMYETHPDWNLYGPGGAHTAPDSRAIQFLNENPIFEVTKIWWNNVLPASWGAPRDSLNVLFGLTHLPTAYAAGKVRLSVTQYAVYERRPLDLLSRIPVGGRFPPPTGVDPLLTGDPVEKLFRLEEPQLQFELNGMLLPGRPVTDVSKPDAFWLEYHLGITNGSNGRPDPNVEKGAYGRLVGRWWGQSLGVFGIYDPNIYSDDLRTLAAQPAAGGPPTGIMSGRKFKNSTLRVGPDLTLSLVPWGIPVYLENNVLFNRDDDPTGFGKGFQWWGGFHQFNWRITSKLHFYSRYDWIQGNRFNDTGVRLSTPPGSPAPFVTGVTNVHPREWDVVGGLQYLLLENFKLTAEFRHRTFANDGVHPDPVPAGLGVTSHDRAEENFFTIRASLGF